MENKSAFQSKTYFPLWVQVVIVFTVITTAVTFFSGFFVRRSEESSIHVKLEQQAKKTVALIAATSIDAVLTRDIPVLETIVQGVVKNDPDIISLVVEDDEGTTLVDWQKEGHALEQQVISFVQDVIVEGEFFGKVRVKFDLATALSGIEKQVGRIRILIAGFLVLLALLSLLSIRYLVLLPVRNINKRLKEPINAENSKDFFSKWSPLEFVLLDNVVTTRLEMENELLQQRDRNIQIIRETPALAYGVHADNTISFVNPAFEKITGFKAEELEGKNWYEIFEKGDLASGEKNITHPLSSDSLQHDFEDEIVTKSGEKRTILWHHFLKKDGGGQVEEVIGFGSDITQRKIAEKAILAAKEEWERTFDSISDLVTIQDQHMRILRANKAVREYLNLESEEFTGKFCYEVFYGKSEPCAGCPERKTALDRATHHAEIDFRNGRTFYVSTSPHYDAKGDFVGIVHTAKDITEQKMLEAQLLQSQKMEAIGTLAGGIAHDFNNILAAVLGYTDLAMLEAEKGSAVHNYLAAIRSGGFRAKDLVSQILAFSRKKEALRHILDIGPVVREALNLLRASLPSTIDIHQNIDSNLGNVLADPTMIHQILMNLGTNAAYAMGETGGVLVVTLSNYNIGPDDMLPCSDMSEGPYLKLCIKDNGAGIDKGVMDRIFEPFFTTKEKTQGTGMGLASVHGIVKDHDGYIAVESEVGKGTTFNLFFPVSRQQPDAEHVDIVKGVKEGEGCVLLVDDEEEIVQFGKRMLEYLGYEVVISTNSKDALQVFLATPGKFDLIITDQTMPGMSGVELSKKILEKRPDMPIILCTGYSEAIDEEKAKSMGVGYFMMKPFSFEELAEVTNNLITGEANQVS